MHPPYQPPRAGRAALLGGIIAGATAVGLIALVNPAGVDYTVTVLGFIGLIHGLIGAGSSSLAAFMSSKVEHPRPTPWHRTIGVGAALVPATVLLLVLPAPTGFFCAVLAGGAGLGTGWYGLAPLFAELERVVRPDRPTKANRYEAPPWHPDHIHD